MVPGCFSIVWLTGLRCDYAKINIFLILENPRNKFSRKIYENIILHILMLKSIPLAIIPAFTAIWEIKIKQMAVVWFLAFWTRYGHFLVLSIKLTHDDLGEGPKWSNSIFFVKFYKKYVSYTCLSWYKMIIGILNQFWFLVLLICIWYPDGRLRRKQLYIHASW